MPEAPQDGQYYSRRNAAWAVAPGPDLSGYVTIGTAQTITGQKTFTQLVYANSGVEAGTSGKFGFAGGGGITKVSGNTWITSEGLTIQFDLSANGGVDWVMSNNQIYCNNTVSVSTANGLTSKAYVDGLDGGNVKTSGTQNIAGSKTFTTQLAWAPTTYDGGVPSNASRQPFVRNGITGQVYYANYSIPAAFEIRNMLLGLAQLAGLDLAQVEAVLGANGHAAAQVTVPPP